MADEIVTRLRESCAHLCKQVCCRENAYAVGLDAAEEILRLRSALALAVGELSTHSEYRVWSPEQLMNQFLEEARNV